MCAVIVQRSKRSELFLPRGVPYFELERLSLCVDTRKTEVREVCHTSPKQHRMLRVGQPIGVNTRQTRTHQRAASASERRRRRLVASFRQTGRAQSAAPRTTCPPKTLPGAPPVRHRAHEVRKQQRREARERTKHQPRTGGFQRAHTYTRERGHAHNSNIPPLPIKT